MRNVHCLAPSTHQNLFANCHDNFCFAFESLRISSNLLVCNQFFSPWLNLCESPFPVCLPSSWSLSWHFLWVHKGWFSKRVVLTDVPPERKPERGHVPPKPPFTKAPFSANRGLPQPLRRGVCETKSKKGARDRKKNFMHRVYSAQRGIETMVWCWTGPDHGVGVDPNLLTFVSRWHFLMIQLRCFTWPLSAGGLGGQKTPISDRPEKGALSQFLHRVPWGNPLFPGILTHVGGQRIHKRGPVAIKPKFWHYL